MTQYTIDLFGWNFSYSSSDTVDFASAMFASILISLLFLFSITIFWFRLESFTYFSKKLYDWKMPIDNYDVYFGRVILSVFAYFCIFYSSNIFWWTSFICMIAYLMKNFIVQPTQIIIENKTTNIRDYEITSFDTIDTIDTKYINKEQTQEQEHKKTKSD